MILSTNNLLPAGAASMVGHLVANEAMAGSTPVASSKLGGKTGGIGPAALDACGRSVGGCVTVLQTVGAGSTPAARSRDEVAPAVPGMYYMLGRPVSWCPPTIYGQRTGVQLGLQNPAAGLDTLAARQRDCRQHQDREERF